MELLFFCKLIVVKQVRRLTCDLYRDLEQLGGWSSNLDKWSHLTQAFIFSNCLCESFCQPRASI